VEICVMVMQPQSCFNCYRKYPFVMTVGGIGTRVITPSLDSPGTNHN